MLSGIFFEEYPAKKEFKIILAEVLLNISELKRIPVAKRKFDLW